MIDLSQVYPKTILTKTGNKDYPINITKSGERVLIANTRDKHKTTQYPKYILVPKNMVCLWYAWPAGRNQSQHINTGFRTNYLIIPRHLKEDKLTFNALGLLQAEMTKGNKRKSNISFSNSEPNLINIILQFFKRFCIQESDWSWSITFNFKLKEHETREQSIARELSAEKFWLKSTSILPEKKRNKFIQYTGNYYYRNMRPGTMRFGSLRIDVSNLILYQLVLYLLEKCRQLNNRKTIGYYLQGIFAGEGSVRPTKCGSLDNVNVGSTTKEDQELYHNYLLNLGINSSFEKNCIKIHNLANFLEIYRLGLLELHPIRHHKFLKCFINYKQIPKRLKETYISLKEEVNLDGLC